MKWYGIRHIESKIPVGFTYDAAPEGADHCVSVCFQLDFDRHPDNVWLVRQETEAKRVLSHDTAWYNAGYSSPERLFNALLFEVFEVEI